VSASERRLGRALWRIALAVASAASATGCQATADGTPDAGAEASACESLLLDAGAVSATGDGGCVALRFLPCGLPAGAIADRCIVDVSSCESICAPPFLYCALGPGSCVAGGPIADAAAFVECVACPGVISGRRPRGLQGPVAPRPRGVGAYFASMARLEAASVRAFRELEGALATHGAPPRLRAAAKRAEVDEGRHARATATLARRFGARPARVRARAVAIPSLPALLEDNAVEGCVLETYGALLAAFQACRADDPRVRRTLRRIADDETRHADLAWRILAWGWQQLAAPDGRRVRRAFESALAALETRALTGLPPDVLRTAGHPSPDDERRLVEGIEGLVRTLWRRHTARTLGTDEGSASRCATRKAVAASAAVGRCEGSSDRQRSTTFATPRSRRGRATVSDGGGGSERPCRRRT
jgi:hypothetical protein